MTEHSVLDVGWLLLCAALVMLMPSLFSLTDVLLMSTVPVASCTLMPIWLFENELSPSTVTDAEVEMAKPNT